jgi:hypothetical protein
LTARPTKFFAALLAALLGVSGVVASFAACPHAAREVSAQAAAHDCCHAHHARAGSRDTGSSHARRAAAHIDTQGEQEVPRQQSHEAVCAPHRDGDSARVESRLDSDAPCADCCAPRLPGANSPALASARGASRDDEGHDATAPLPTFVPPRRYEFTPTQHAPPAPRAPLHALNSVLLI